MTAHSNITIGPWRHELVRRHVMYGAPRTTVRPILRDGAEVGQLVRWDDRRGEKRLYCVQVGRVRYYCRGLPKALRRARKIVATLP